MSRRYELTDGPFALIRDPLPGNGHRGRNVVERCVNWMKENRRLGTDP